MTMKYNNKSTIPMWCTKRTLCLRFYSTIYMITLTLFFQACDEFVAVDVAKNQLIAHGVFEEKATANAAMTDIYSKIRDFGMLTGTQAGLTHTLGLYTDELVFYGSAQNGNTAFYTNTLVASSVEIKNIWNLSYNQIYAANSVIAGVDGAVKLPQSDKDELKGEALFVRAMLHFYLTNIYGGIPYITTTDYEQNRKVSRNTVSDVYDLAKADLNAAIALLPNSYIGAGRTRPNKYAAYALLARVCLYAGVWEESSNAASAVLNNTVLYPFETDLNKIFLKESTSTIWQLSPKSTTGNTNEAATFIFTSTPPALSAMNKDLVLAFEAGDQRAVKWVKTITNGGTRWYHPFKYKKKTNTGTVENSIIFRLGELYLIRAEARARAGELIGAKQDLNVIRTTAGLANTTALTQQELLIAILQERRVELFTEFGHRFFDLKRFNQINEVLSASKSGWDANDVLFPIPETEIDLNGNLAPQNPGY